MHIYRKQKKLYDIWRLDTGCLSGYYNNIVYVCGLYLNYDYWLLFCGYYSIRYNLFAVINNCNYNNIVYQHIMDFKLNVNNKLLQSLWISL